MSKVKYYSWDDVSGQVSEIARQLFKKNWFPDYIVGITPSGLVPATMLSTFLDVKMHTLDVAEKESNCWMSEDAFGYVSDRKHADDPVFDRAQQKKILIVDSINVNGGQFAWIKNDWMSSCLPDNPEWENVFQNNVKFAALSDESLSADFHARWMDNQEIWYPWEQWWR